MGDDNFIRADEVNIQVTSDSEIPEGWEKTHQEYKKPITDFGGYYIYSFESEHFLVSQDVDKRDEKVHVVSLLKVKKRR